MSTIDIEPSECLEKKEKKEEKPFVFVVVVVGGRMFSVP